MQLTREQRKNLELYRTYRQAPPTFWRLVRGNLWRYALMAALVALLFWLAPIAGLGAVPPIALGVLLGVLGRDTGIFLRFIRVWPALAAVLDWERVEGHLTQP